MADRYRCKTCDVTFPDLYEPNRHWLANALLASERHEHEKVVANLKMDIVRLTRGGSP